MPKKKYRETHVNRETKENRAIENQSHGVIDGTHATQDFPPLATPVNSLPAAAQIALAEKDNKNVLFTLARALKAHEATVKRRLTRDDLDAAFSQWWIQAQLQLPPNPDFDEWRLAFLDTWSKVKSPLGSDQLVGAIHRADTRPLPLQAKRYTSKPISRLVAVCYHLQRFGGASPMYLSVRDAARVLEIKDLTRASRILYGLVQDEVLSIIEKGKPGGKLATRFRYRSLGDEDPSAPRPSDVAASTGSNPVLAIERR